MRSGNRLATTKDVEKPLAKCGWVCSLYKDIQFAVDMVEKFRLRPRYQHMSPPRDSSRRSRNGHAWSDCDRNKTGPYPPINHDQSRKSQVDQQIVEHVLRDADRLRHSNLTSDYQPRNRASQMAIHDRCHQKSRLPTHPLQFVTAHPSWAHPGVTHIVRDRLEPSHQLFSCLSPAVPRGQEHIR